MSGVDTGGNGGTDRAIKTFVIGQGETLAVGATDEKDQFHKILELARPDEYALFSTSELTPGGGYYEQPSFRDRLNVDELQVIGNGVELMGDDGNRVTLEQGGEEIVGFDRPGYYGLLYIPFDR